MTLKEIINKIFWHPDFKKEDYVIVILDRGAKNNRREIPLSEIEVRGNFIVYFDTYIPLHRVLEVKNKRTGEIIYQKLYLR
ncbi:Protein of unknown function DUF504 [Methanocaldococcus infernus ME]|uniref:UPF0248 protein Metin_1282 n=1 Tax=Methanocaldococcus infernus (strain DSM 11812 / JCM 15783 / ME) TaxID=573063 RepID=D5VTM9_METIM|nr:DUF504 domain-containing protein [Methanocaldococcus infernus]ADG13932.1 Protein of unknown function DUF504 [Methanocaldococcus infernus ME]